MNTNKKNNYSSPQIKVMLFALEHDIAVGSVISDPGTIPTIIEEEAAPVSVWDVDNF